MLVEPSQSIHANNQCYKYTVGQHIDKYIQSVTET